MANFAPLKTTILNNLKKILNKYKIISPFLDIGGGIGDVTEFMVSQGFHGKYIDYSPEAGKKALLRLKNKNVKFENVSFLEEKEKYNLLLCLDVLEHVENDREFVEHFGRSLNPGGHLVLVVPVNQSEWRWDDEFYGHYRRYDPEQLVEMLELSDFMFLERINITFPVFWLLRRIYTKLLNNRKYTGDKEDLTKKSTCHNAWDMGIVSKIVSAKLIWYPVFFLQGLFKRTSRGHECMFVFKRDKNRN